MELHLIFIGFITWFATGLDDIVIMSLLLKDKMNQTHKYKNDPVWLLIGHLLAVGGLLVLAGVTSRFIHLITENPFVGRLPGIIVIMFGLYYLWVSHINHRKEKGEKFIKPIEEEHRLTLFISGFLMYAAASGIDDYAVNTSILIQRDLVINMVIYGVGFLLGSVASFYLSTKISHFISKIKWIDYAAAIFLIVIGTLILGGIKI